jgi:hypothetical protein
MLDLFYSSHFLKHLNNCSKPHVYCILENVLTVLYTIFLIKNNDYVPVFNYAENISIF